MDIHERLRYLRAQSKLTTRAFGSSINMSGGAITNMEKKLRNITDRTINDVCRVYNVNPDWLINGNEPIYEDVVGELDIDDEVKELTKQYCLLNDRDRKLVKNIINFLADQLNDKPL